MLWSDYIRFMPVCKELCWDSYRVVASATLFLLEASDELRYRAFVFRRGPLEPARDCAGELFAGKRSIAERDAGAQCFVAAFVVATRAALGEYLFACFQRWRRGFREAGCAQQRGGSDGYFTVFRDRHASW